MHDSIEEKKNYYSIIHDKNCTDNTGDRYSESDFDKLSLKLLFDSIAISRESREKEF